MSTRVGVAVGSLVLVWAAIAVLSLTGTHIDGLELRSYDFLLTVLRGPVQPSADVVIVAIDESSIQEFASQFSWPWPRSVHAELIRRLDAAGARVIAFDVIFDLPSDPAGDTALAAAIRASRVPVVLAASSDNVVEGQFQISQQIRPLPALVAAGARVGFATILPDVDGELRRAPISIGGAPSLATAVVDASGDRLNAIAVPVITRGGDPEFLINYTGGGRTVRTVSYYQALDPEHSLAPGFFRGKVVFVGRSDPVQDLAGRGSTQDLLPTPFDLRMPGVEVHANAFDTLVRGHYIRHAGAAVNWAVLALSGVLIAALMLSDLRLRTKLVAAPVLILIEPAIAGVVFVSNGYWLYTVQPLLAGIGVFMLNALYQYAESDRERLVIRKALTGYVSKQMLDRVLQNPSALDLGGEQIEATVLFSDIVGFSSIAERLTPRDLSASLNEYFTRMGDIVMAGDGMIDKYIGDAIMAVWGAPLRSDRHAVTACAAALAMKRSAEAAGGLQMRIGLNTGSMMAGNLGHRLRMNYTVIGDAVNLASRLEGANKEYGSTILVSEATMLAAGDAFIFRRLDRIRVLGKQDPVSIFELLVEAVDDAAAHEKGRAESFSAIVAAYDRGEWQMAINAATRHRSGFSAEDRAVTMYEERCHHFLREPPAAGWDGVYRLASK